MLIGFLRFGAKVDSTHEYSKVESHHSPVKTHYRAFCLADTAGFCYFCPAMKTFLRIAYWLAALILLAVILTSLDYSLGQAVLISLTFCPCALALEFWMPKARKTMDKVCLSLAVLVTVVLLIIVLHFVVWQSLSPNVSHEPKDVPPMLINPAFLGLILTALALGDYFWTRWLAGRFRAQDQSITFFSERKSITLKRSGIAYVESNDTEVRVVTTDGEAYRNKTGIGQWENLLAEDFLRIHRSYLVNTGLATLTSPDTVTVCGTQLPVSRKYKESVQRTLQA